MTLCLDDFNYVRALVLKRSAIVLESEKLYLAESRLSNLAQREGYASISELLAQLRADRWNGLHQKVVEAMTTNETSFFRDHHPFEALKHSVIPEMSQLRAGERRLHIWCGAASTGQEPYTIAILLREHFPLLASWNIRITASDLSTEVLERARKGRYSQLEVNRGMPAPYLAKYFTRQGSEWQLKDEIRSMVDYRQINLIDAWPTLPPMDIIFLRNVLIYFDVSTKKSILSKIRQLLLPHGYLFLGGAETTVNLDDGFVSAEIERSNSYRLRGT